MWIKIYFVAMAVSVLVMAVLAYLSHSWLHSVTKPADVIANFQQYSSYYWTFLIISSLVLMILGNVLLWIKRISWALWMSLAYFSVFVLIQTWLLNSLYLDYQSTNNLSDSTFSFLGLGGAFLCVIAAVGVFFDQFIVLRILDRMHLVNKPEDAAMQVDTETDSEI
jgi:hypothetical protein